MSKSQVMRDIASGRLPADQLYSNFAEFHSPLTLHEAQVAADRCYFCHDAPCIQACPTSIDVPLFIRQIMTGTPEAAARTIFEQNILGGMCARVCPTETLCEEACVREEAEGKPVIIGQLQRFATDQMMRQSAHPFQRAAPTGHKIAVLGAGPAGLACAHRLALYGHDVDLFDARPKGGGLNEYGVAAYKSADNFAQEELNWLMSIGGITLHCDMRLGENLALDTLVPQYDAVFLGLGLAGVRQLAIPGNDRDGVEDAVTWIARMRQSEDKTDIAVGRDVVVIGGGMTSVDAAVQSKLLGAERVTIVYRRNKDAMSASALEQDLATSKGVHILYNASPKAITETGVVLAKTQTQNGTLLETEDEVHLEADQVLRAIGQSIEGVPEILAFESGKIWVDETCRTSVSGIWAGGDCTSGGEDLTVTAVAQGRDAAEDIHNSLMKG